MVRVRIRKLTRQSIAKELHSYEVHHGLSSREFYEKYNRGEMGDGADVMRWASLYEMSLLPARRPVKA